MSNVWDAMRKHQAEQKAKAPSDAPAKERPPADDATDEASAITPKTPAPSPQAPEPHLPPPKPAGDGIAIRRAVEYGDALIAHHDRGSEVTEEYRALRTNLLAQSSNERFCFIVTSANPGEGKSVTASNLSIVMTERVDQRTVLVDADLRRGRLAEIFGLSRTPGLAEVLRGETPIHDAIQETAYPNLSFLAGGNVRREEVGELLGRAEIEDVIARIRRNYDYVVIDSPPINATSDAGLLGRVVGEALLVVRMNKTPQESIDKAIRLLHAANVHIAGMVLTHRKYHIPNYLYKYS